MPRPRAHVPHAAAALAALLMPLVLLAPAALAAIDGPLPDEWGSPASPSQASIKALYDGILPVAVAVGILVEVLILYAVLRFRARRGPATHSGEHERGNHRLEIAWTVPPAAILLVVGVLSAQTLTALDNPPVPPGQLTNVTITGTQWAWQVTYPDNRSDTELWVKQGVGVYLTIVSKDVIHDWNIPDMGITIDAIPGRVNHAWFLPEKAGDFLAQCREFCGSGHGAMRTRVHVFPPAASGKAYGNPATSLGLNVTADQFVNITAQESGCPAGKTFCFLPAGGSVAGGRSAAIVMLDQGQSPHNLCVQVDQAPPMCAPDADKYVASGQSTDVVFQAAPGGKVTYWCNVPGHRQLGMEGTLTVA